MAISQKRIPTFINLQKDRAHDHPIIRPLESGIVTRLIQVLTECLIGRREKGLRVGNKEYRSGAEGSLGRVIIHDFIETFHRRKFEEFPNNDTGTANPLLSLGDTIQRPKQLAQELLPELFCFLGPIPCTPTEQDTAPTIPRYDVVWNRIPRPCISSSSSRARSSPSSSVISFKIDCRQPGQFLISSPPVSHFIRQFFLKM